MIVPPTEELYCLNSTRFNPPPRHICYEERHTVRQLKEGSKFVPVSSNNLSEGLSS